MTSINENIYLSVEVIGSIILVGLLIYILMILLERLAPDKDKKNEQRSSRVLTDSEEHAIVVSSQGNVPYQDSDH